MLAHMVEPEEGAQHRPAATSRAAAVAGAGAGERGGEAPARRRPHAPPPAACARSPPPLPLPADATPRCTHRAHIGAKREKRKGSGTLVSSIS
eukprot:809163-Rhodomonas_salina.6